MVCVAGIGGCDGNTNADGAVCADGGGAWLETRIGGSIWPNGVKNVSDGAGNALGL